MKIAILKERRAYEARVAATPETVGRYRALGAEVAVEAGAGAAAAYPDDAYAAAGATIVNDATAALKGADIVLKMQGPTRAAEGAVAAEGDELARIDDGAMLIGLLSPYGDDGSVKAYAAKRLTTFAMEFVPRITRAQSMDVLSSQSNLAGYKAVLDATAVFGRAMPMMMTAAGRINPARVFIMGAGVAGLQAIATARRLGAVVSATDVRPVAKEQVESLGATFVMVESEETASAETAAGYAREMSDDYKRRQAALVAETITKQDIVITTALIPGRPAPVLVTEDMVKSMKPGSVVVDLAVEQGGNCTLSEPGKVVRKHGVSIVGHLNVPSRVAVDASALYARNVLNFVTLMIDSETKALKIDWEDEIIQGTCLTRDGRIVHPALAALAEGQGATGQDAAAAPAKPRAVKAKPKAPKTDGAAATAAAPPPDQAVKPPPAVIEDEPAALAAPGDGTAANGEADKDRPEGAAPTNDATASDRKPEGA